VGEVDRMRGWMDQLISLRERARSSPRSHEAAAAHHSIQDRKNIGKVLLTP
jgi:hypothetical protein